MNTLSSPFIRRVALAGGLALLAVALALVVLWPGQTLAQSAEPEPAAPPPSAPAAIQVNAPATTPEPATAKSEAGAPRGSSDVQALRFRPQLQLVRGQSLPHPQSGDKPATEGQTSLERPLALEPIGPQEAYVPPDYHALLEPLSWGEEAYEGFEGAFPSAGWTLYDFSADDYQRTWGDTNYRSQVGSWSAWPAAYGSDAVSPSGGYPNNLASWMTYGPMDFSSMADVFVGFGLWYETELAFDWVYFCASIDDYLYNCVYWSGYSGGWTDQAWWLTSYAGYPEVWVAWIFESDYSIVDDGPFVDEVSIWGYDLSATPTPTVTPDPSGQLIENGSFETGDLSYWTDISSSSLGELPSFRPNSDVSRPPMNPADDDVGIASVGVTDQTYVDGAYSAYLWQPDGSGNDWLYQTFYVPDDVTDFVVNYWFAITTDEPDVGRDFFCASLRPASDLDVIQVDLGCLDSIDASGYWQQVLYTLTTSEVAQIEGQTTALVFEMYNTGAAETWSAGWVDYVRAYAFGGSGGEPIDPNEPNDDLASATTLTCGSTISGTIGDAMGGYDEDWFRINNVPTGRLDVDIDADTQVPPSVLDSVVHLWNGSGQWLAWNDDDGSSFDSYLAYTNTVSNATFYVSVKSYSGYGSPDSFYDLTVQCGDMGSGPPPGGSENPPPADTWTVMLYLNAEDPDFEQLLTQYRTDIESFIGSKSSFLRVAILYDGPPSGSGSSGTTRYLVQPNGSYSNGVNRWNLGELNMGHPDTLANFVNWAMDQYPAENYYLAIDDHGDGAYGISFDDTPDHDQLTPPELYSALKNATRDGSRKIDILDYEACLMGLAENAYDVRQWVDYVVFSEQISWGINTYPNYFYDLAASDTPLAVGQRIMGRYHAEALAANGGRGYPHTISLIDTSKMVNVRNAVSNLGNALVATGNKNAVNDARDNSQAFAADYDATHPLRAEYIDLWDLADNVKGLAATQASSVKWAVNAAVVRELHASGGASGYVWDHSGAHGLAIYYPPARSSSAFNSYVAPSLYRMSNDGTWDEFLDWVVPSSTRRGMTSARSQDKLSGGSDTYADTQIYLPLVLK